MDLAGVSGCSTVQAYGFIYTLFQFVQHHRRLGAGWVPEIYWPGDVVEIATTGVRLPVADSDRCTDVPEPREQGAQLAEPYYCVVTDQSE